MAEGVLNKREGGEHEGGDEGAKKINSLSL